MAHPLDEYGPLITFDCAFYGHKWVSTGGCNCGCEWIDDTGQRNHGQCSVPVHVCTECHDCDYGENAEATDKRESCRRFRLEG